MKKLTAILLCLALLLSGCGKAGTEGSSSGEESGLSQVEGTSAPEGTSTPEEKSSGETEVPEPDETELPGRSENEDHSYRILETPEDLLTLAAYVNRYDGEYLKYEWRLGADIDMTGHGWVPIGIYRDSSDDFVPDWFAGNADDWITYRDSQGFAGVFDGQGHTVSGIDCTGTEIYGTGFFGFLTGQAVIRNLNVEGSFLGERNVGGIAGGVSIGPYLPSTGRTTSSVTVENCTFHGQVHAIYDCAGGLMGATGESTLVSGCFAEAEVSAAFNAGGMFGMINNNATARCCSCKGTLTGQSAADSISEYGFQPLADWYTEQGEWQIGYLGGFAGGTYGAAIYCCVSDVWVRMMEPAFVAGNFIGYHSGRDNACFYVDIYTDLGAGYAYPGSDSVFTAAALTKKELADEAAFIAAGWNFDEAGGDWYLSPAYGMPVPRIPALTGEEASAAEASAAESYRCTSEKGLNLREGPGADYPVRTVIPLGAIFPVEEIADGWCRGTFNGVEGWASVEYLEKVS